MRLRITAYLSASPPPVAYINSVRAIVFQGDAVVVVRGILGPTDLHIVPGRRREVDETLDETLRREVLEETGWTIANVVMLGFMHFHILDRRDFFRTPASSTSSTPPTPSPTTRGALAGDVEIGVGFRPLTEIRALSLQVGRTPLSERGARPASADRAMRSLFANLARAA